jgi:hypothetical protein
MKEQYRLVFGPPSYRDSDRHTQPNDGVDFLIFRDRFK